MSDVWSVRVAGEPGGGEMSRIPDEPEHDDALVARHLRIGWWTLLVFLSLGIVLEAMHGLKVRWYLDVSSETRRLMWTLAHAHGTLLGLAHIGFAATVRLLPRSRPGPRRYRALRTAASPALTGATVLLPGGFLLGGAAIHGGDPGLGILLVPVGAALLLVAVAITAVAASSRSHGSHA